MKFHVPDMSCGHCTTAITQSLQAADSGAQVKTDLTTREIAVATTLAPEAVIAALKTAGYSAELI
ncbi:MULTISPECIES: heavy-metal-associated domain-containing protein [unclassified Yoonia]|uniref:heavy-metal-associated domain-containing protein n=1 Tax=unclassified Yoonia TaxID=2629118 RepID=UPI002AFE713D|nr:MULTISPECIES: heavy-metal-associated domain-containing protein [unclassified Yoonia]